ncbi:S-adenosyl-L-methionine-dependent methyltransferase [Xylariales sp. PMI_506]|nr:S-adenosyl-L-methionine-dependent methyltransferase [Xylariales sp. PMI_506]
MAARGGTDGELSPESGRAAGSAGRWHIPLPALPSQVLGSYGSASPPSQLFSENSSGIALRNTTSDSTNNVNHTLRHTPQPTAVSSGDTSFASVANDLINEILDRIPTDGSVVDPDSVVGESLRLYHGYKDGKYLMPNDAAEQDRLDLQHELFRIMYDGWLCLAPLSQVPGFVLDIGTGTGIWAFEFAEQNPSSYVIGADLSAIQPTDRNIINCEFVKCDIEDDWIFPTPKPNSETSQNNISFDYIHLRLMFSCFNDPRIVMKHAFENLNSGGWIEFQETTAKVFQANANFSGNAFQRWADSCTRGAATVGRDLTCVRNYKQWLEEIGFVDVTERMMIMPVGEWPSDPKSKVVGRYCLQDTLEGLRGVGYKMLRLAGLTTEEVEALTSQCLVELRDPQNMSYWHMCAIYGRKP